MKHPNEELNVEIQAAIRELRLAAVEQHVPQLTTHSQRLLELSSQQLASHGKIKDYLRLVAELPKAAPAGQSANALASNADLELNLPAPRTTFPVQSATPLEQTLRALGPWKKGPFQINDCFVDAEWRSDLKWERVLQQIGSLHGETVLDVGTGNGYFLLRALGAGARAVLGLEPSVHFTAQFLAIARLFPELPMALLPLTGEAFGVHGAFSTVMSMGVLYHRRSPLDHLTDLKSFLQPGGRLILETIAVAGPAGFSLVPEDRYAQMRNVWFLPSPDTLAMWLRKLGFVDIELGPLVTTTSVEQRTTDWTGQPSLVDFLDAKDSNKTVEGHPAPQRIIVTCRRPQ